LQHTSSIRIEGIERGFFWVGPDFSIFSAEKSDNFAGETSFTFS